MLVYPLEIRDAGLGQLSKDPYPHLSSAFYKRIDGTTYSAAERIEFFFFFLLVGMDIINRSGRIGLASRLFSLFLPDPSTLHLRKSV